MGISRRQFLAGAAVGATAAATGNARALTRSALPNPATSGLDHIVFVCMENRSFDHYLGWLPGADGRQKGLSYPDDKGLLHPTHHLTTRQGCDFNDPDHSYEGGRLQFAGGKLNGFRKGDNDDFALGYYTEADLPFYSQLVKEATTYDRWFCPILGPTYPNRFYTHAAYTDRITNEMRLTALPTIWDSLARAGVSGTYFYSDLPFLALWGEKYLPIARPYADFLAQAATGTLPAFSYVDPFFLGEEQGGSNDDHPHADIRRGQALVYEIAAAIASSPAWSRTALIVTYDEWGGFYDHVKPPRFPDDHDPGPGPDRGQAGFRVPTFVLSPFARRGAVDSVVSDHTAVLKLVEWRHGLAPLTKRDAAARNLAATFDFAHPRTTAPSFTPVLDPGPHICGTTPEPGTGATAHGDGFWAELRDAAARIGWPIY
ncbi:MAG: twin-arginine translocation signal domain-containing protein [Actinobacteria bacterium]|nr:twin-arginine translocation signal domain-containing protein [Actinomycetota bacterium]MCA1719869.1 twin-arginine translocation signal domain-containing protein [Actinomycetota bacterium]